MTPADDKALDAPVKKKRVLPRRGKRHGAVPEPAAAPAPRARTKPRATRRHNPAGNLWGKALAAVRSARVLADAGDGDGAADRAYYAVFSAARAVLAGMRASFAESKGHGTIVRRFEQHVIRGRGLDMAFGRAFFSRLSHARWVADYGEASVDRTTADAMLGEAERFLEAAQPYLRKAAP